MFQRFSQCVQFLALSLFLAGLAQADEPVVLRYKLVKGGTSIIQTKSENKTTQTIMGNNLESTISQTGIAQQVIDEVDAEGTAKIKTKTEQLKATVKVAPLGDYEFDSKKTTDRDKSSVLGGALTPLYERLVGSELQLEVTPRGTVKKVTGYAQLVGDLVKANPLVGQFAGGGSDNAALIGAQGQLLVFPETAVKPGDKWENPFEMEMPGLGLIKGKQTITFLSVEDRKGHPVAKLSTSSDISFDLKLDQGGAKISGKITTAQSSGSAEFDMADGKLLKQSTEMTLSGQLNVEVNNMAIPVQVSQTVSSAHETLDKLPE